MGKYKKNISSSQLAQEMDRYYEANNHEQALAVAAQLLQKRPLNRSVMERVTALFIDYDRTEEATAAIAFLQVHFPETGYQLFLRCRVEQLQMHWEKAVDCAERALARRDTNKWQTVMLHNILGHVYRRLGMIQQAVEHYRISGTTRNSSVAGDDSLAIQDYSNYLFTLHNMVCSREFLLEESRKYNDFFTGISQYVHQRKPRHKKLRIGYVSPDLRFHVVAFFSYAFFKCYDKNRFEVYCYAKCQEDAASQEFAASVDHWTNICYDTAQQAAAQIYQDEIDILVDLSGHTANNCLPILAYKPAPIQISGIGWFDTTGLATVDYFLVDSYTDPEGLNDAFFTEKLLRLPHSHFCYMWHDKPLPVSPAPYRANGYITFGSFNNFSKVTDEILQVWAKILRAVPRSRLFLKAGIFNTEYGIKVALRRMEQAGIPMDAVDEEYAESAYLSKYGRIDIALDTFPYPGGGTTCDALYMGVPVITLVGQRHNARFGYSLLMNMGLEECCAFSEDEYVRKAVELAGNPSRLTELHQTLRRRMRQSPVMDDALYMGEVETAYERIWQDWLYEGRPDQQQAVWHQDHEQLVASLKQQNWKKAIICGGHLSAWPGVPATVYSAMGMAYGGLPEPTLTDRKRAVWWLQQAVHFDKGNSAELWLMLSKLNSKLLNHLGAYTAVQEAMQALDQAVQVTPTFRQSIYCQMATASLTMGSSAEAFEDYRLAWENASSLEDRCAMFSSMLLTAHYLPFSQADLFDLHQVYQTLFAGIRPLSGRERQPHDRLRIGYISPDFRQHVMFAFYYGLLVCRNTEQFEVYCYNMSAVEDAFTEQVRAQADHYSNVSGMTYPAIAERIQLDEIDILVDLAGHSAGSGLPVLAWRPAPVQLSGLGYLDTTGLAAVDYFLTDAVVDPPGEHEGFFTEELLYLPSQFGYTGRSDVPEPVGTPAGTDGNILFGVFNHYRKITDEMLQDWHQILQQVPGSRLLLKSEELASDSLVDAAYERLKTIGFDMDRVSFEPADENYMERYMAVDIALDTYPYPGGGMTFDALYMGVPVINRYGQRRNTRFGLSILTAVGLSELAADTNEGYIERAVALSQDRALLDGLHRNLRTMLRQFPAGNLRLYTRAMEQNYQEIWNKYSSRSLQKHMEE